MRTTVRSATRAALLALAITLGACRSGGGGDPETAASPANQQASVAVRNDNFADVDVYAFVSGQRMRVGMVTGHSSAVLRLPSSATDGPDVYLAVRPIGSNRYITSDRLYISRGDRVEFFVSSYLPGSNAYVVH